MTKIPEEAIKSFGAAGGIQGLVILALIVIILIILYGFRWYIMSQREHETAQAKFHAEQYEKRLEVEQRLADSMNQLVMTIKRRPCQQGDSDAFTTSGTKRFER